MFLAMGRWSASTPASAATACSAASGERTGHASAVLAARAADRGDAHLEVTIFNAAVLLMGLIGTTSLAAHAIALQIAP